MITIFIRTILIYIILVASMRLMGKRQVGELQPSELSVTIILSEIAAYPLTDKNIPFLYAIISILLLLSIEVIVSFFSLRFPSLKIMMSGKPSMIIKEGKLDQKELLRQRLCLSEVLCAIRQEGVANISDVQYAILEENGKLSVFPKAELSPLTPQTANIKCTESGIAHSLIVDRRIIERNLTNSGWTKEKLLKELRRKKLKASDIFLFSVTDDGAVTIILKEKTK